MHLQKLRGKINEHFRENEQFHFSRNNFSATYETKGQFLLRYFDDLRFRQRFRKNEYFHKKFDFAKFFAQTEFFFSFPENMCKTEANALGNLQTKLFAQF
jgi:hypothetical protein